MSQPPSPTNATPGPRRPLRATILYLAVIFVVAALTIAVMLLLQNISKHKLEARQVVFRLVDLDESTVDPVLWGKNFPRQYDSYKRTVDMERTRYGGSEADPADAHKTVSKIDADPRLKRMWAGYAFATDFREERGHAFMLIDQRDTDRVKQFNQPGACLHCHASTSEAYRKAGLDAGAPGQLSDPLLSDHGKAQLMAGFTKVSAMSYADATQLVDHPVACIDCHDPGTMQLRVTRPGFMLGIASLARSSEPTPHLPSVERWRKGDRMKPYDPNVDASRQEMRTFACAQCHVEYYCGPKTTLFYPWDQGLKVEQIEAHYDQYKFPDGHRFFDWKHKTTGAEVIKAQHPEFELWSQGIHARSGVSCADCHMPYQREGAVKISDHHVRSPMLNTSNSCLVCHRWSETEMKARVQTIQDRTKQLMDRALDSLMDLIGDIERAKAGGVTDARMDAALAMQRKAQWRIDFINAENSMGFHAPQEAARILGEAIDFCRQGQLALARSPAVSAAGAMPSSP